MAGPMYYPLAWLLEVKVQEGPIYNNEDPKRTEKYRLWNKIVLMNIDNYFQLLDFKYDAIKKNEDYRKGQRNGIVKFMKAYHIEIN